MDRIRELFGEFDPKASEAKRAKALGDLEKYFQNNPHFHLDLKEDDLLAFFFEVLDEGKAEIVTAFYDTTTALDLYKADSDGNTVFHKAVEVGAYELVVRLCHWIIHDNDELVLPYNNAGRSPLHVAFDYDSSRAEVASLLPFPKRIKSYDELVVAIATTLVEMTPKKRADLVKEQKGVSRSKPDTEKSAPILNATDAAGRSVIHYAAEAAVEKASGSDGEPRLWPVFDKNLKSLFALGANFEIVDENSETPLIVACKVGNGDFAAALLTFPNLTRTNYVDSDLKSAFFYACENGLVKVAETLCDDPHNLDVRDDTGKTPLLAAVERDEDEVAVAIVDKVLSSQAFSHLGARDENGKTVLHYACEKDHVRIVAKLLEAQLADDALFSARDNDGYTPLMKAVQNADADGELGDGDLVALLLASRDHVDLQPRRRNRHGQTALHIAVARRSFAVVERLLEPAAPLTASFDKISFAAFGGSDDGGGVGGGGGARDAGVHTAQSSPGTLDASDDPFGLTVFDKNGKMPLHLACELGLDDVAARLMDLGVPLSTVLHKKFGEEDEDMGKTALHLVCESSSSDGDEVKARAAIIKSLVAGGAYVDAQASVSGDTPLHVAVRNGNLALVKALVNAGARPNVVNRAGKTAFYVACAQSGGEDVATFILEQLRGLDPRAALDAVRLRCLATVEPYGDDGSGEVGKLAIHVAAGNGMASVVADIIETDASSGAGDDEDIAPRPIVRVHSVRDSEGRTPLHHACCCSGSGAVDTVKELLSRGAVVNESDYSGLTPLHLAVTNRSSEVIDVLFADVRSGSRTGSGGEPVSSDDLLLSTATGGTTPVHAAVSSGNDDLAVSLLKKLSADAAADLLSRRSTSKWTLLHDAVSAGLVNTTEAILDAAATDSSDGDDALLAEIMEARIDSRELNGVTPLLLACCKQQPELALLLIKRGCDVSAVHSADDASEFPTALHYAAQWSGQDMADVVGALLDAGADAAVLSSSRMESALTVACRKACSEAALVIIEKVTGTDLEANVLCGVGTTNGLTPLHYACYKGMSDVVAALLDRDVPTLVQSNFAIEEYGYDVSSLRLMTPLHYAAKTGNLDDAALILSKSVNPHEEATLRNSDGETLLHMVLDSTSGSVGGEKALAIADFVKTVIGLFVTSGSRSGKGKGKAGLAADNRRTPTGSRDRGRADTGAGVGGGSGDRKDGDSGGSGATKGDGDEAAPETSAEVRGLNLLQSVLTAAEVLVGARAVDVNGRTPLMIAAQKCHWRAAVDLLALYDEHRSWVNLRDNQGLSAVYHWASSKPDSYLDEGDEDAVNGEGDYMAVFQTFVELDANFCLRTNQNVTPLMEACSQRNEIAIRNLLQYNCDEEAQNRDVETALYMAVSAGVDAKFLDKLAAPSIVDLPSSSGKTPFLVACSRGDFKVASYLLSQHDDVWPAATDGYGNTALHLAITALSNSGGSGDTLGLIRLLLGSSDGSSGGRVASQKATAASEAGAGVANGSGGGNDAAGSNALVDVNLANESGETALHLAARGNLANVVELLLAADADVTMKTQRRSTALHLACSRGATRVANLLLSVPACMDVIADEDEEKHSALSYAVANKQTALFDALLKLPEVRVDLRRRPLRHNSTPLFKACENSLTDLTGRLLEVVADESIVVEGGGDIDMNELIGRLLGCAINSSEPRYDMVLALIRRATNKARVASCIISDVTDDYSYSNMSLSVLAIACNRCLVDIAEGLMDEAGDASGGDRTPLYYAAKHGLHDIVASLVGHMSTEGLTKSVSDEGLASHTAVSEGYPEVLRTIINSSSGSDRARMLGARPDGATVLHLAAARGLTDVVDTCISFDKETLSRENAVKDLPVHVAAAAGNLDCVLHMLDADPSLVTKAGAGGKTLLHYAAELGNLDLVRVCVALGADVRALTEKNSTALNIACVAGHVGVVRCLIDAARHAALPDDSDTIQYARRVKVSKPSDQLFTDSSVLLSSIRRGHEDIAAILVACGISVAALTEGTPLVEAIRNGCVDVALAILGRPIVSKTSFVSGAVVGAACAKGLVLVADAIVQRLVDEDRDGDRKATVDLFIKAGSDGAKSPFEAACEHGHETLVIHVVNSHFPSDELSSELNEYLLEMAARTNFVSVADQVVVNRSKAGVAAAIALKTITTALEQRNTTFALYILDNVAKNVTANELGDAFKKACELGLTAFVTAFFRKRWKFTYKESDLKDAVDRGQSDVALCLLKGPASRGAGQQWQEIFVSACSKGMYNVAEALIAAAREFDEAKKKAAARHRPGNNATGDSSGAGGESSAAADADSEANIADSLFEALWKKEPLFKAVESNRSGLALSLLEQYPERLTNRGSTKESLVSAAVRTNQGAVAAALIDMELAAIDYAAEHGDKGSSGGSSSSLLTAASLVSRLKTIHSGGSNALHAAATNGLGVVVNRLLELEANPYAWDPEGEESLSKLIKSARVGDAPLLCLLRAAVTVALESPDPEYTKAFSLYYTAAAETKRSELFGLFAAAEAADAEAAPPSIGPGDSEPASRFVAAIEDEELQRLTEDVLKPSTPVHDVVQLLVELCARRSLLLFDGETRNHLQAALSGGFHDTIRFVLQNESTVEGGGKGAARASLPAVTSVLTSTEAMSSLSPETVLLLFNHVAAVIGKKDVQSCLMRACGMRGLEQVVDRILHTDKSLLQFVGRDGGGNETPLMEAISKGQANTACRLLRRVKGVETPWFAATKDDGNSVLHEACSKGLASVVALLIVPGAFPDVQVSSLVNQGNSDGDTPFMLARSLAVAQVLLTKVDSLAFSTKDGVTVFSKLCKSTEQESILRAVLESPKHKRKALEDLNSTASGGTTSAEGSAYPLWHACSLTSGTSALIVLKNLAPDHPSINAFHEGVTPLHQACRLKHADVIFELLKRGASVVERTKQFTATMLSYDQFPADDLTPLHLSIMAFSGQWGDVVAENSDRCAKLLLGELGAAKSDMLRSTPKRGHFVGMTPIHVACEYGFDSSKLLESLMQKKDVVLPLDERDDRNNTPIDYTIGKNPDLALKMMQEHATSLKLQGAVLMTALEQLRYSLGANANEDTVEEPDVKQDYAYEIPSSSYDSRTKTLAKIATTLIDQDIGLTYRAGNDTPLLYTCHFSLVSVASQLIAKLEARNIFSEANIHNTTKRNALHLAATVGCKAVVDQILERVDSEKDRGTLTRAYRDVDLQGDTPLHKACKYGHSTIALKLMDKEIAVFSEGDGAGVGAGELFQIKNKRERMALHFACMWGDAMETVIVKFISEGVPVHSPDITATVPLMYAYAALPSDLANKQASVVTKLIKEYGSDKNSGVLDSDTFVAGKNILHQAAHAAHTHIVQSLIRSNVDLNKTTAQGRRTALHLACDQTRSEKDSDERNRTVTALLKAYVEKGSGLEDIYQADAKDMTPLHIACEKKLSAIALSLLNAEAVNASKGGRGDLVFSQYIDRADNELKTPLFYACENGLTDVVERLLACGATVAVPRENSDHVSVLHIALGRVSKARDDQKIAEALIDHVLASRSRAALTQKSGPDKSTPLHEACLHCAPLAEKLIGELSDDDLRVADVNGHTPLMNACKKGHRNVIKLLIQRGVDVNAVAGKEDDAAQGPAAAPEADAAAAAPTDGAGGDEGGEAAARPMRKTGKTALHFLLENTKDVETVAQEFLQVCQERSGDDDPFLAGDDDEDDTFIISGGLFDDIVEDDGDENTAAGGATDGGDGGGDQQEGEAAGAGGAEAETDENKLRLRLDIVDDDGQTPLHVAICNPSMSSKIIQALVRLDDSQLTKTTEEREYTPLSMALEKRSDQALKLIELKAPLTGTTDKDGNTPLHLAAANMPDLALKIIDLVKDDDGAGDYFNKVNSKEKTALHIACESDDREEVAAKLAGLDSVRLEVVDKDGNTPLHIAVKAKAKGCISTILNVREDKKDSLAETLSRGNSAKQTPLHLALATDAAAAEDVWGDTPTGDATIATLIFGAIKKLAAEGGSDGGVATAAAAAGSSALSKADEEDNTALHIALENRQLAFASRLIDHPESASYINSVNKAGDTPLHIAMRKLHESSEGVDIVSALLAHKAINVNVVNGEGDAPIHLGLKHAKLADVIKAHLLNQASEPDRVFKVELLNGNLESCLHVALIANIQDLDLFRILVNPLLTENVLDALSGPNSEMPGLTILHIMISRLPTPEEAAMFSAAQSKNKALKRQWPDYTDIAKKKIAPKTHEVFELNTGDTALHVAARRGLENFVEVLSAEDWDINATNFARSTPLHLAVGNGYTDVVVALLKKEAAINVLDDSNRSPLHIAAQIGNIDMVGTLIEAGADVNCLNSFGEVPAQVATSAAVRRLLLDVMKDLPRVPYVLERRSLYQMGVNDGYQLGLGDTKHRSVPIPIDFFSRLKVVAVSTNANHTLALTDSGAVYSCGRGESGQLGSGSRSVRRTPGPILGLKGHRVIQISAGFNHSACVTDAGLLFTFGDGKRGQLGTGNTATLYEPDRVSSEYFKDDPVDYVACGPGMTAVVTRGGHVYTCGDNTYHALGRPTPNKTSTSFHKADLGDYDGEAAKVSCWAGPLSDYACFYMHIITRSGKVLACGTNLPNGAETVYGMGLPKTKSDVRTATLVPSLKDVEVTDIASSYFMSLAVTATGAVYSSGYNLFGLLGINEEDTRKNSPEFQLVKPLEFIPVARVSVGHYHAGVVSRTGRLYMWGDSDNAKTLRRDENNRLIRESRSEISPRHVPFVGTLQSTFVSHVACGMEHTVVVSDEGLMYSVGDTDLACLGLGSNPDPDAGLECATVFLNGRAASVALGTNYTAVVTEQGLLFTYGANQANQLGHTADEDFVPRPRLVSVLQKKRVIQVSAGRHHMAAVTSSGQLWVWGKRNLLGFKAPVRDGDKVVSDADGYLEGAGDETYCVTPRHLPIRDTTTYSKEELTEEELDALARRGGSNLEFVTGVSASHYHTVAVTRSGKAYTWGDDNSCSYGELGRDTGSFSTPAPVVFEPAGENVFVLQAEATNYCTVVRGSTTTSEGRLYASSRIVSCYNSLSLVTAFEPSDTAESIDLRVAQVALAGTSIAAVTYDGRLVVHRDFANEYLDADETNIRPLSGAASSYVELLVPTEERGEPRLDGRLDYRNPDEREEFASVACAADRLVAVSAEGRVYVAGVNKTGSLGLDHETDVKKLTWVRALQNEMVYAAAVARDDRGRGNVALLTHALTLCEERGTAADAAANSSAAAATDLSAVDLKDDWQQFIPPVALVSGFPRDLPLGENGRPVSDTIRSVLERMFSHPKYVSIQPNGRSAFVGFDSLASAKAACADHNNTTLRNFANCNSWLQLHWIRSCACCDETESERWYRWQDQATLPFSKEELMKKEHLENPLTSLHLCSRCTETKGLDYAYTNPDMCRTLCAREVLKKIQRCRKLGAKFTDPDFPPTEVALWRPWKRTVVRETGYAYEGLDENGLPAEVEAEVLAASGEGEIGDPSETEPGLGVSDLRVRPGNAEYVTYPSCWRRISDMFSVIPNPSITIGGTEGADVEQGGVGTCYLLGCIAVLATKQENITDIFITHDYEIGIYSLRFSFNGMWKYVIIDDWIPCFDMQNADQRNPKPVYGWCSDRNELYVMLIEKAYAKLKGSYEDIDGGVDRYAMVDLTGGVCEQLKFSDPKIERSLKTGAFWETMMSYQQDGKLMSCYIEDPAAASEEKTENGLLKGHAYAITGICTVGANRLLQIRNPHGNAGWTGAWSTLKKEVLGGNVADDGQFYMSYNDFISPKGFTAVDVTTLLTANADSKGMNQMYKSELKWEKFDCRQRHAFELQIQAPKTKVAIELRQEGSEDPAKIVGNTIALVVAKFNDSSFIKAGGDEHAEQDSDEALGCLSGDLRAATIVDRIYPTQATKVSLELVLWQPRDKREHYVILPSTLSRSSGGGDKPFVCYFRVIADARVVVKPLRMVDHLWQPPSDSFRPDLVDDDDLAQDAVEWSFDNPLLLPGEFEHEEVRRSADGQGPDAQRRRLLARLADADEVPASIVARNEEIAALEAEKHRLLSVLHAGDKGHALWREISEQKKAIEEARRMLPSSALKQIKERKRRAAQEAAAARAAAEEESKRRGGRGTKATSEATAAAVGASLGLSVGSGGDGDSGAGVGDGAGNGQLTVNGSYGGGVSGATENETAQLAALAAQEEAARVAELAAREEIARLRAELGTLRGLPPPPPGAFGSVGSALPPPPGTFGYRGGRGGPPQFRGGMPPPQQQQILRGPPPFGQQQQLYAVQPQPPSGGIPLHQPGGAGGQLAGAAPLPGLSPQQPPRGGYSAGAPTASSYASTGPNGAGGGPSPMMGSPYAAPLPGLSPGGAGGGAGGGRGARGVRRRGRGSAAVR